MTYNTALKKKSQMKRIMNIFLTQCTTQDSNAIVIDAETLMSSKTLKKNGLKTNLLSQETFSESDLNNIKQIYKFYETLNPSKQKIFFKTNLREIFDDESQLREICVGKAKQISDDQRFCSKFWANGLAAEIWGAQNS